MNASAAARSSKLSMPRKETLSPSIRATWAMAGVSCLQIAHVLDQKLMMIGLPWSALRRIAPLPSSCGKSNAGAGRLTEANPTVSPPAGLLTDAAGRDQYSIPATTIAAEHVAITSERQLVTAAARSRV